MSVSYQPRIDALQEQLTEARNMLRYIPASDFDAQTTLIMNLNFELKAIQAQAQAQAK